MKHHHLYTAIMFVLAGQYHNVAWANDSRVDQESNNVLPTIHLKAEQADPSYTVKKSKSATKLDLSLKETPQSVTVFTAQQIEDQNLNSTNDVLAQTAGVTMVQYGQ